MHVIGTRAIDSAAAADLAEREEGLTASAGIHPNDAADADDQEWEQVVRLVESGRVQAVHQGADQPRLDVSLVGERALRGLPADDKTGPGEVVDGVRYVFELHVSSFLSQSSA